jgi:hypothetical protein
MPPRRAGFRAATRRPSSGRGGQRAVLHAGVYGANRSLTPPPGTRGAGTREGVRRGSQGASPVGADMSIGSLRGEPASELCKPDDYPTASSQVHARQRDTRTIWFRRPLHASACAELPHSAVHLLSFVIHSNSFAAGLALKAVAVQRRRATYRSTTRRRPPSASSSGRRCSREVRPTPHPPALRSRAIKPAAASGPI